MTVKASVVIPAYNARNFIVESISSVLKQTNAPPFEVIMVDDGSHDRTAEIVEKIFPSVRVIRKVNGGPGSARNIGVQNAESEIILFHDADDIMLEGRIAHQVAFMMLNSDVAVSFGSKIKELHPDDCEVKKIKLDIQGEEYALVKDAYRRLLTEDIIVVGTAAAIRRSAYLAVGGQPEDVMVAEDYALYLALARQYPIAATPKKYTWYRQSHGTNLMASKGVYLGRVTVIGRELENNFTQWEKNLQEIMLAYFNRHFNIFARYYWAYEENAELDLALSRWKKYLRRWTTLKWRVIPIFVPPIIGRSLRATKHRFLIVSNRISAASKNLKRRKT
jgi:glycosyltransferase involved in cell wall biosynthesis